MLQPFGDAATADTLDFAFYLSKKKSYKRFTYGYGRKEDIASMRIVLSIYLGRMRLKYYGRPIVFG